MAFVNEYISDEDKKKIDWENFRPHSYALPRRIHPSQWTIDREREVFMLWGRQGRDEDCDSYYFLFYWKGEFLEMRLTETFLDKNILSWKLEWLYFPEQLKPQEAQIIADLKDALTEYGFSGQVAPEDRIPVIVRFEF